MNSKNISGSGWYGDVLSDLGAACRRDGLMKSAELLDDVAIVLAQEQARIEAAQKAGVVDDKAVLKLVVN